MIDSMDTSSSVDFEIKFFEKLVEEKPDFVDALIPLAESYTRKGMYEKGLVIDERLTELCPDDSTVFYNLACSLALLERRDEAFKIIEKALDLGYRDFDHMRQDSDLESLQGDPSFVNLIERYKTRGK